MRKEIGQTAYYGLIGSTALLLASVGIKGSQQWERVQRVAQGVFLASAAVALYDTLAPLSKAQTIAALADVKGGSLNDLSVFAYESKAQFLIDWPRDKPEGTYLQDYTHAKLIQKFFHQGLGNAVLQDLKKRVDLGSWNLQLGVTGEPKFQIKETKDTLEISYRATLQLLDGLIKTPLKELTSTLTVEAKFGSATSFIYTLEPLDDFE